MIIICILGNDGILKRFHNGGQLFFYMDSNNESFAFK